jgi:uncharacterized damage-inducible protein DinB
MLEELIKLYDRDLQKLAGEIAAFRDESNMWRTTGEVKNSAGNLALHLVGNLSTYIGKNLGNTNYVRNREAEFSRKDVPRPELLEQIARTRAVVIATLQNLIPGTEAHQYPEDVLGYPMTTGYFLMHLLAHLSYHLGQINYLRRILEPA